MLWFGPAVMFLGSALGYWEYRSPESAMRLRPSWVWPHLGDLSPAGLRRYRRRARASAVFFLLVGIVWSGAIVLSAVDPFGGDDRSPEYRRCVEEERPKAYPSGRTPEEICDSRYPTRVDVRPATG